MNSPRSLATWMQSKNVGSSYIMKSTRSADIGHDFGRRGSPCRFDPLSPSYRFRHLFQSDRNQTRSPALDGLTADRRTRESGRMCHRPQLPDEVVRREGRGTDLRIEA